MSLFFFQKKSNLLEKQGIKLEFREKGPSLNLNQEFPVSKILFYYSKTRGKRLVLFRRMRTGVIVYVNCEPLSRVELAGKSEKE